MRSGGVGTVALVAAVAICGLLMLGSVGPATPNEVVLPPVTPAAVATDDPDTTTTPTTRSTTAESTTTSTTATSPTKTPTTTTPATTTPTTTTPTTTTPTTTAESSTTTTTPTITTTSTTTPSPTPVPLTVTASNTVAGAGGTVTFDGTCAVDGDGPLGPVLVWVVGDTADEIDTVETGLSSASWTYTWTAPTDESGFDSFTFQFWCGDPARFDGGYPAELQHRVDMVASAAPPETTSVVEPEPVTVVIPETD